MPGPRGFHCRNLLVDPETLEVTGVVDWELARAGSAYTDLGSMPRFERAGPFTDAVVDAYREFIPSAPADLLDRVRAADLFALVELAARDEDHEVVVRSRGLLEALAHARDLHAVTTKS